MTIRCRMRPVELWLWKYVPGEHLPIWVFQKFHRLGSADRLETAGGHVVLPGQYCGLVEPNGNRQAIAITVEECNVLFQTQQVELAPDEMPEGYDL